VAVVALPARTFAPNPASAPDARTRTWFERDHTGESLRQFGTADRVLHDEDEPPPARYRVGERRLQRRAGTDGAVGVVSGVDGHVDRLAVRVDQHPFEDHVRVLRQGQPDADVALAVRHVEGVRERLRGRERPGVAAGDGAGERAPPAVGGAPGCAGSPVPRSGARRNCRP
jgi:hypothetical protein